MKKGLLFLLAIFLLVEEWLWDVLTALGRRLSAWLRLALFERWLAQASPQVALAAFGLPIVLILPVKFAALWLLTQGNIVQGLGLLISAKLLVTLLISRMFAVTRHQLLTFAWFSALYATLTQWIAWAHDRIRATNAYQQALGLKRAAAAHLAEWLRTGH